MARLYAALITLSLIWGLSFVFIKVIVDPAGVWGTTFLRCLAGLLILLPLFIRNRRKKQRGPLPIGKLFIVGLINAGLPWSLIAWSETQINSNTASILNATTPLWTALIGFALFSVVLTGFQWMGIVVGFLGILVLMDFQVAGLFSSNFIGIGTMLLATVCYGFAGQYTRRALQGVSMVAISTFQLLVGMATGLVGMMFTRGIEWNALLDMEILLSIIGLGCFGSGVAALLFFYVLTKGSPEFASTVTYLIPASAMVWGFVLLGEPITSNLILGLIIIFAGVFLSSRKGKRRDKAGKTAVQQ
ncbi:DMT family transporter [Rossellomorea vietnamensis]|uniref:DMT family transporter n=1 Tax=Rossellomorea vietnamensis TaxID=218284 RepID=A0A5D4KGH4_9BACI|nr:DMT family transporter [Rossellomorea vietnamensis]TYR76036.1 DMT family transporter [Rossellomorea vietnamensis]